MFNFPEGDEELLGYIEDVKPSTYDKALNLFAELAEKHRGTMEAIARTKTWLDTSPEDVVSDTILKGFLTIHLQLGGSEEGLFDDVPVKPSSSFKFERKHGLTLKSWLLHLMKGARGGVLRTHNRQAKARSDRHESAPEHETVEFADMGQGAIEETIDSIRTGDQFVQLEAALQELPARQRFIAVTRFGLGIEMPFSVLALKNMAREFDLPSAHKIATRAARLDFSEPIKKLQMQDIAHLLDICPKQVRRELLAAFETIKVILAGGPPSKYAAE